MLFSNPFKKKEVDYEELEGAASEAAQTALKGEVSRKASSRGSKTPNIVTLGMKWP